MLIQLKQPKHSLVSILPKLFIALELQFFLHILHTAQVPLLLNFSSVKSDKKDNSAPNGHINLQKNLYVNILKNKINIE